MLPRQAARELRTVVDDPDEVLLRRTHHDAQTIFSPDNVGESSRGESAAAHAEGAAAFERLFPSWYTGGHALAVGLLAILTVSRRPASRRCTYTWKL